MEKVLEDKKLVQETLETVARATARLRRQGDPTGTMAGRPRNREPGYDGKRRLLFRTIENPDAAQAEEGLTSITVSINAKESGAGELAIGGQIKQHQELAAILFRRCYEALYANSGVIDPERPVVDGGGGDPFSLTRLSASHELNRAAHWLGKQDYRLVREVCGEGYSLTELARRRWPGLSKDQAQRKRKYLGQRLRDALDELAGMWKISGKGDKRSRGIKASSNLRISESQAKAMALDESEPIATAAAATGKQNLANGGK